MISNKDNEMKSYSLVIGCVAENQTKYLDQAMRLVKSLRWFGGTIANADFIVCVIDAIDPQYEAAFAQYSVPMRLVRRFSPEHPQSNKLRFLELEEVKAYDHVVLLDCDTIIVQDPSAYFMQEGFWAKIVDGPTITFPLFENIFRLFSLATPKREYECTVKGDSTIPYFNAGVLIFSRSAMAQLVPTWVEFNHRLIGHMEVLEDRSNFCEQASLALAVAATEIGVHILGNEMNFPDHFDFFTPRLDNIDPLIIHYHWRVDSSGCLKPSQYALVNQRIEQFNRRLSEERGGGLISRLFRGNLYR
jgi:hypothetical protein